MLEAELAALKKMPQNSSQPPSTTYPYAKPSAVKSRSQPSPGGQPGHDKHERTLAPLEQCGDVVPCVPRACRPCGGKRAGFDAGTLRHQVWGRSDILSRVTEHQRHRLLCGCGSTACGELPWGAERFARTAAADVRQVAGVVPTNNAAERALRCIVLRRKLSFGKLSAAASSNDCRR